MHQLLDLPLLFLAGDIGKPLLQIRGQARPIGQQLEQASLGEVFARLAREGA